VEIEERDIVVTVGNLAVGPLVSVPDVVDLDEVRLGVPSVAGITRVDLIRISLIAGKPIVFPQIVD
jgi:hypothetical protein